MGQVDFPLQSSAYLKLGEAPGSKFQKAQALGIKVIGEEELKKMCAV